MSEHQRETAFLRQCILCDDTAERHQLDQRLTHAQRDERCVRRAAWLMVLLTALSMAGLCYSAIFRMDHPQNLSQFLTLFVTKVLCALGLGSLICLVSFVGLGVAYRKQLDQRREECRRLAAKLLNSRLGSALSGIAKEQDPVPQTLQQPVLSAR